jgi:hypothetical protein
MVSKIGGPSPNLPKKRGVTIKTTTKGFFQKEEWANNGNYP